MFVKRCELLASNVTTAVPTLNINGLKTTAHEDFEKTVL